MKKHLLFFLLLPATTLAQLTGQITDGATRQPLPFASVAVLTNIAGRDSLVGGATATETGQFRVANLPAGVFIVRVTFVGYQTMDKPVRLAAEAIGVDLGTLALLPDASLLKEVTVTGQKNQMDIAAEKRVFNVSKNLTTVGGNAETLLRNVPSLTIDASGGATMRNMTATIYVNGKPTQLSLAQIPADQIESVEVISNPSARYEAAASGGIVNLVLKKNRDAGYNGTVSAGYGSNNRYDATLNLNLNQGKWNLTALYNLNATHNPLTNYAYRTSFAADRSVLSYYRQNTNVQADNVFQTGRLAADYTLNKQNTLTVAGTYVAGVFNSLTDQYYETRTPLQQLTNYGNRTTRPQNNFTNAGMEFDWKHSFAQKGRTLSLTTAYNHNQVSNAADWYTTSFNPNGTSQTGYPETDRITGQTVGNQYLAQLDYVKPVNDSTKWEMGLRSFTYVRDQQYFFSLYNPDTKTSVLQPTYSQDARITETVNAAYLLYSTRLPRQYKLEVGLRVEQSSLRGVSRLDGGIDFGYDYPSASGGNLIKSLFPSLSITRKLTETSEIGLAMNRKIGRPGFRQLFVGIQSNDRQNVTIGNPAIQPEFVNTAELNYTKSWGSTTWLSTVYSIFEDNTIKPIVVPSASDPSVYVTTFFNADYDLRSGIDNTLTMTIGNLNVLANFNGYSITLKSATYKNTLYSYNAKLNLGYKFPANISAQLNLSRDSRFPQLQGYRAAITAADFAVRKSFMNNRAALVFTINDLFNSRRPVTVYDQPTAYQESMSRREIRFYKLSIQLPLGKAGNLTRKKEQRDNRPDVDFSN